MQWFRIWHGFIQSPKWTLVAQRANCSRGDVLNVALFLVDYASRNADRGSIEGADLDECEVVTGVTRNVTERVVTEITRLQRAPIAEMRWLNWDEYQPRDTTAAERMRRHREKKKQGLGDTEGKETVEKSVTSRSVTRNVTSEQNRTEQNIESRTASNEVHLTGNGAGTAHLKREFNERFWPRYPRKKGKDAALSKFLSKAKAEGVEPIISGLEAALAEWGRKGTQTEFIPYPATWLNQGRFRDEADTAVCVAPKPKRPNIMDPDFDPYDYGYGGLPDA